MRKVMLLIGFLLAPVSVWAQNPCTAASTTQLNPGKIYTTLPEFNMLEADGQPRISNLQLAYFAPSTTVVADQTVPVTTTTVIPPVTLQKSAFTLVAGTPDCYTANISPIVWAGSWPLLAGLKVHRDARPNLEAADSPYRLSNPFGMAPSALAAPGRVVVDR